MPKFRHRKDTAIWGLIERSLTRPQQSELPIIMQLSERTVAHRFNRPHLLTTANIQALAPLLKVTPAELVVIHGCGEIGVSISLDEAKAMGVTFSIAK